MRQEESSESSTTVSKGPVLIGGWIMGVGVRSPVGGMLIDELLKDPAQPAASIEMTATMLLTSPPGSCVLANRPLVEGGCEKFVLPPLYLLMPSRPYGPHLSFRSYVLHFDFLY